MAQVPRWTGREARLLRLALRKNQRDFASEIGVSQRMISEWERRGADIVLRTMNQKALDTAHYRAGAGVQERFAALMTEQAAAASDPRAEELLRRED